MSDDKATRPASEPQRPSGDDRLFGERAMDVVVTTPVEVAPVIDPADPTPSSEDFDA